MNRKMTSALGMAAAVAAAIASGQALADDITIDTTPFVSVATRAEVRAELMKHRPLTRYGADEPWAQYNEVPQFKSQYTSAQARAEYTANRAEVNALTAEDSGSSYLWKMPRSATTTMGGPAR